MGEYPGINGIVQGADETSSSANYEVGKNYMDEETNDLYTYVFASAVVSACFPVTIYSHLLSGGTRTQKITKITTASTVVANGFTQIYFSAQRYGFIMYDGIGSGYVTSSVANNTALVNGAATAGLLAAPAATRINAVMAKALAVGLGTTAAIPIRIKV